MSKRREVIDFGSELPAAKLTTVLGATLKCLADNDTYSGFKSCIIMAPPKKEDKMEEMHAEKADEDLTVGETIDATVEDVGETLTGEKKKRKLLRRK